MKIGTIGIVTKDRPHSLEAMLPGYIENGRRFGRNTAVVVMDDSKSSATRMANRTALTRLSRRYGTAIAYAGLPEKRVFAAKLAAAGLPRDVVEFALFGLPGTEPTMGANRNALLLQTAGEAVFCVDDDVLCRLAEAPNRRPPPPALGPSAPEHWFFKHHAEALAFGRFGDQDLLEGHERFLGCESPRGKVWSTLNGIIGDCALSSIVDFNWLRGEPLKRLRDGNRAVSRQVLRVVRRESTGATGDFTSTAFSLDNREMTPPFMPSFRFEDGMFGATLDKCFGGCVVHLPSALLHVPPESRTFKSENYRGIAAIGSRMNYFIVQMCLQPFRASSRNHRENLRSLGGEMRAFARLPREEFCDLANRRLRRLLSLELLCMEKAKRREGSDRSGFRRGRLDAHAANLAALIDSRRDLLSSIPRGAPPIDWKSWQRLIDGFGGLAQAWPDILAAAKELRGRGAPLAEDVRTNRS
jgi:hypothetical protein